MKPAISVITCTHNPRQNYIDKVLAALKSQTLPLEQWELLLIDNASERLLSSEIDLSWHPQARHIREDKLGLTPARLRGIKEAQAETLIFVDDDNVLDSDYLEITLQISRDWPMIGAWGGQLRGGFEQIPPDWAEPYLMYLGIREFEQDQWSNLLHQHDTTPCGAGMCVRHIVAQKYADLVCNDPKRLALDRKGTSIISCGDTDLAFTACDLGLGTGQFASLKLTHLMPASRLEEEYLIRLYEGIYYSHIILDSFRGKLPSNSSSNKLAECYRLLRMSPRKRRFFQAKQRGIALATQEVMKN
ncbi:MAG: glycosyltransferase family 2 protein [Symploca sp. SIO1A3]|nr:glycosyltransferase family 2 protein [Symploca sp. SIO1A3]